MKKIIGFILAIILLGVYQAEAVPMFCLFDRSTSLVVSCQSWDTHRFNTATHVEVKTNRAVDRRTERWDGATGVRSATAREIADFDAQDITKIQREAEGRLRRDRETATGTPTREEFNRLLDSLGILR